MILKVFKVVWFISMFAMMGVFIYAYASWPERVSFSEFDESLSLSKSSVFYACLLLTALFNTLVFIISRMKYSAAFTTWVYGFVTSFHAFLITGLIFITIFNSLEKYNYSMIGPSLYATIILLLVWSIGWPLYLIYSKIRVQSKVN